MPDVCGNGALDPGEQCDDGANASGDGCSPTCHEEAGYDCTGAPSTCTLQAPGCGDGIIQSGEECDDDGNANGDGCNSMCKLEFDVTEMEANNTTAQAQMLSAGNHRIKASFSSDTDVDMYKFTTTAPMKLELESYTTIDPGTAYDGKGNNIYDCTGSAPIDTYFRLYDAAGDPMDTSDYLLSDDDDGSNNTGRAYGCSYLGAGAGDSNMLPAGTYTLRVSVGIGGAAGAYFMDLRLTP
jgi:cysteine-rich repeat protein